MRKLGIKTHAGKSLKAPNGFVVFEGASSLDGNPIAVIVTLKTSNAKTGEMPQVWILRSDINPVEATKTGEDATVCGNCVHRHHNGGACYVNVGQAPNAVYKAYKAGKYPKYIESEHAQFLRYRKIRLGAYGDPAAAPFEVMQHLASVGLGHTGYTHQAAHKNFDPRFFEICMVSADSPKQAAKFQALGARTFRVAMSGDGLADNEIECLSDSRGITCLDCGLCNGAGNADNIAITVHGSRAKRFNTSTLIPTLSL